MGRLRGSRPYGRKTKYQHFANRKEGMNMQKEQFDIKALAALPGVEEAAVNLEEKAAKVKLTQNVTDESFKAAVETAGYQLTEIK